MLARPSPHWRTISDSGGSFQIEHEAFKKTPKAVLLLLAAVIFRIFRGRE